MIVVVGNIEVWYNGRWGNICDDEWDIRDAGVVCKQLGYVGVTRVYHSGKFGDAKGKGTKSLHQDGSQKSV